MTMDDPNLQRRRATEGTRQYGWMRIHTMEQEEKNLIGNFQERRRNPGYTWSTHGGASQH